MAEDEKRREAGRTGPVRMLGGGRWEYRRGSKSKMQDQEVRMPFAHPLFFMPL